MSTDIQKYGVGDLDAIAVRIARSRLFGLEPEQAFTLCLLAQAEGLHPVAAVRRWHIIEGKPSMRADAMQAEFQRHGGRVEWVKSTDKECQAIFRHPELAPKGFGVHVTFAELDKAGVTRGRNGVKDNWRKFPRQMLRARAISEGVRAVDPGIVVGVYTPEEISDFDARETPIETAARVVPPDARQPSVDEIGDELVDQFEGRNPRDRHQPVKDVARGLERHNAKPKPKTKDYDARPHTELIADACRHFNESWSDDCRNHDLPFAAIVNVHQVQNHLGTWAVETGLVDREKIEGADEKRDRSELVALLSKLHAKNPERFSNLVGDYCSAKLDEARTGANLAEYASDEAEVAAEDEPQEPVEAEVVEQ